MKALIITLIVIQAILIIVGASELYYSPSNGLMLIIFNSIGLFLNIQNLDRL